MKTSIAKTAAILLCGLSQGEAAGVPSDTAVSLRELSAKLRAVGRDFRIGCSVPGWINDADKSLVTKEFDIITSENDMKVGTISPRGPGQYDFAPGDRVVNFAVRSGAALHGHNLAWYIYNPSWVDGSRKQMTRYITDVVAHFKGKVAAWDVVNEPLQPDGSLRIADRGKNINDLGSVYGKRQGPSYLDEAFRTAHAADPKASLILNEFEIETNPLKFEGFYSLVKGMKERKVPIHAVGFQMHLYSGIDDSVAAAFAVRMRRMADLGLDIYLTEMDGGEPKADEAGLREQARTYARVARACLEEPRCKALQVWGIRDNQSWRIHPQDSVDYSPAPLLFTADGQRKPVYYAIQKEMADRIDRIKAR